VQFSRRARYTGIVAIATIAALAGLTLGNPTPQPSTAPGSQTTQATPAHSASQGTPGPQSGPTVWYSVLGNGRLTLYERRLDGRSEPLELAWHPSDQEGESSFIVGPSGSPILLARRASERWAIEPIDLGDPQGAPAWSLAVRRADFRTGVWSPDGRYWAGYASGLDNRRYAVVVDAQAGQSWELELEPGRHWIQGFEGLGPKLVLRDEGPEPGNVPGRARSRVVDPAIGMPGLVVTGTVDAPPHSSHSTDFAPRTGLWAAEDYDRGQLVVGNIATGELRYLDHPGQRVDWVGFAPESDRVLVVVGAGEDSCGAGRSAMRIADLEGGSRALWEGSTSPNEFTLAPEGDFVGFDAWGEGTGSSMVVVDIDAGRSVELPMPEGSYLGHVLAIEGGIGLPDPAVPPRVPTPEPSPTPAPELVAGAPQLVIGSVDYDPVRCEATINVRLTAPAVDGSLAVLDALPAKVIGDAGPIDAYVEVTARPGSSTVLVSFGHDQGYEAFLWTPEPGRRPETAPAVEPIPLPEDWPADRIPNAWSPDGSTVGLSYPTRRNFLWFNMEEQATHRLRLHTADSWERVIGWSPDGSSVVVQRNGCLDFCTVVRNWVGRIRLADGHVRDVTPDAPFDALGTGRDNMSASTGLAAWSTGPRRLQFSVGINVPGDFTLRWQPRWGALTSETRVWSRDGRSLYVVADRGDRRVLLRFDNPRAGATLRPKVVGRLPDGAVVRQVEIDEMWVRISVIHPGSCRSGLVNLATGDAYLTEVCARSEPLPAWS
jgi:hypothetical protein